MPKHRSNPCDLARTKIRCGQMIQLPETSECRIDPPLLVPEHPQGNGCMTKEPGGAAVVAFHFDSCARELICNFSTKESHDLSLDVRGSA